MEKDSASKLYFGRAPIMADLFNAFVYDGKQVLKAENLTFIQEEANFLLKEKWPDLKWIRRVRDLVARCMLCTDGFFKYALFGLEIQSTQDVMMLFRIHLYNILSYIAQLQQKEEVPLPPGHLLMPVISLVLNLSGAPWKYPTSLAECFGDTDELRKSPLWKYICNYSIVVIDPYTMDEKSFRKLLTENRTVLHCVRHSEDKGIVECSREYLPPNGVLSNEGHIFLRTCLDFDLSFGKCKEGYDMCRGVELWKQEQREFGRKEGLEQGVRQGIEQGVRQGVEIERNEIILSMLGNNVLPEQIHQMTNIPLAQILDAAAGMESRIGK